MGDSVNDNTGAQDLVFAQLLDVFLDVAERYHLMTGQSFIREKEKLDWWNRYQLARMRPA